MAAAWPWQTRAQLRRNGVHEALYATYTPGAEDYAALIEPAAQGADRRALCRRLRRRTRARIVRAAREHGGELQLVGGDGLGMAGVLDRSRCRRRRHASSPPTAIPADSPGAQPVLAALARPGRRLQPTVLGCLCRGPGLGGGGSARGQPRPGRGDRRPAPRPVRDRAGPGRVRRARAIWSAPPGSGRSGTRAATHPPARLPWSMRLVPIASRCSVRRRPRAPRR